LLPGALECLKNYRDLPRTTAQALTALKNRLLMSQLLHLYHTYFPDAFRRSEASIRIDEEIGYSPREMEFVRLVAAHLFPLHGDWLPTYVEEVQERFPYIPIFPYARNWWEEPEAHDPGWQLLLAISGTLDERSARALLESIPGLDAALRADIAEAFLVMGVEYDLMRLQALCTHIASPLSDLALALSMLLRSTGNRWLDCDGHNEMPYEEVSWSEHAINYLTRTFEQAQAIEARGDAFASWLSSSINERTRLVLDLIRQVETHE